MAATAEDEVLDVSRQLLTAIDKGDWKTYASLCDPSLTAYEPEAEGHLVAGLPFHQFYFELPGTPSATPAVKQSSIASPHVRVIGDCAIVCYVRLTQKLDAHGSPVVVATDETRVWQKQGGRWKHIHFHRSPCR